MSATEPPPPCGTVALTIGIEDTRTVKCGLRRICNEECMSNSLLEKARRAAPILNEASRLVNVYLLDRFNDPRTRRQCMHDVTETFLDRAVQLVSTLNKWARPDKGNAEPDPTKKALRRVFDTHYAPCRPEGFVATNRDDVAQILLSARSKLLKNAMLHVSRNFEPRTRKWIRFQVDQFLSSIPIPKTGATVAKCSRSDEDEHRECTRGTRGTGTTKTTSAVDVSNESGAVSAKSVWQLVNLLYAKGMNVLCTSDTDAGSVADNDAKLERWLPESGAGGCRQHFQDFAGTVCGKMQETMRQCAIPPPTPANLKEYWFRYLPFMHEVLADFVRWHEQSAAAEERAGKRHQKQKRAASASQLQCSNHCPAPSSCCSKAHPRPGQLTQRSVVTKHDCNNTNKNTDKNRQSCCANDTVPQQLAHTANTDVSAKTKGSCCGAVPSIKGLKLFTLFPEHHMASMYIHIDNTALEQLDAELSREERKAAREAQSAAQRAAKAKMTPKEQEECLAQLSKDKEKRAEQKIVDDEDKAKRKRAREEKKVLAQQKKAAKEQGTHVTVRKPRRTKEQIAADEEKARQVREAKTAAKDLVNQAHHALWAKWFDLPSMPKSGSTSQFAYSLSTDGYSASIHIRKGYGAKGNPAANKKKKKQETRAEREAKPHVALDLTGKRVVAVDPGRRDLFVAVEVRETTAGELKSIMQAQTARQARSESKEQIGGDDNDEKRHSSNSFSTTSEATTRIARCSNARWQHMSGTHDAMVRQRRWIREARLHTVLAGMPSARVATVAAYQAHLRYLLAHFDRLMDFRHLHKQHKLRWNTHQKRRIAMDTLCHEIVGGSRHNGGKDVVVAFGAASVSSTSPGYASAPTKGLARALCRHCSAVLMVDEYLTSQVCSHCGGRCLRAPRHLQVTVDKPDLRKPNGSRRSFCKRIDKRTKRDAATGICQVTISKRDCLQNGLLLPSQRLGLPTIPAATDCAQGQRRQQRGVCKTGREAANQTDERGQCRQTGSSSTAREEGNNSSNSNKTCGNGEEKDDRGPWRADL